MVTVVTIGKLGWGNKNHHSVSLLRTHLVSGYHSALYSKRQEQQ